MFLSVNKRRKWSCDHSNYPAHNVGWSWKSIPSLTLSPTPGPGLLQSSLKVKWDKWSREFHLHPPIWPGRGRENGDHSQYNTRPLSSSLRGAQLEVEGRKQTGVCHWEKQWSLSPECQVWSSSHTSVANVFCKVIQLQFLASTKARFIYISSGQELLMTTPIDLLLRRWWYQVAELAPSDLMTSLSSPLQ